MNNNIITVGFKENFIEKLGGHICWLNRTKGFSLDRIAVVFGGLRPALFLKKYLAQNIGKPFLSPKFFTIDDFISFSLNKVEIFKSSLELDNCYLLYEIAQRKAPEVLKRRESFAQFLPWAREMLNFIEQVDLEHIEDKALLSIKANAEIGYDVPEDINNLLKSIVHLRAHYHEELYRQKKYSRGLQYLKVAGEIGGINYDEFDKILFCNFFYFNRSQEIIIKNLFARKKAELIFQGDQRKWPIFDRLAKSFNVSILEEQMDDKPDYQLHLYTGFDSHSQISTVREILKQTDDLEKTVIVLPSADNIVPLVSEIASLVKHFNISMGYPLKRSSLYALLQLMFKAQNSIKNGRYYAKDYLNVLKHPFVKNLDLGVDPAMLRLLIHKIEEILIGKIETGFSGSTFFQLKDIEELDEIYDHALKVQDAPLGGETKKQLKDVLNGLHELIFDGWREISNFEEFSCNLELVVEKLVEKSLVKDYPLNINIALRIFHLADEFKRSEFNKENFALEELFRIFDNRVVKEMVAFQGSPLKGLQILGLFETRSLSFENVIILDANEGVLPSLNIYEPLIPREVMVSLGLDRLEYEEEIQRYQFTRLITCAKNVHLVYEESKDKEKSRFIEGLIWEQEKLSRGKNFAEASYGSFNVEINYEKKTVKKTKEVAEFLKGFVFSASSINTYLKDPIEFYYNYVLGLREAEDLLDEPEARHVGTFIHALLEEAFTPFLGKKPFITNDFKKWFMELFLTRFKERFEKSMKSDTFLLKAVIKERLERFLSHQSEEVCPKVEKITHLESIFNDIIPLSCGNIKFKYIVDRVDQLSNGTIMIVDYKTGSIDQMPKEFEKIRNMEFSREAILENIQSFQIPLYFYYLNKTYKNQPVNAALYNLRTLKLKTFLNEGSQFDLKEMIDFFLEALGFVVSEILDPSIDFVSTE